MRITYRYADNKDYWHKRWSDIPADIAMDNVNAYPLKYALNAVAADDGPILEAGCGAGRILRYYHERGYDITGFDFIKIAIDKLKAADSTLKVEVADITQLPYPDSSYKYILAFGLYHNLDQGLIPAVKETARVLAKDGTLCASFRADNWQTRLTDWHTEQKVRSKSHSAERKFHKANLSRREFRSLFERNGFNVKSIEPVENMPILYKFAFFRSKAHKRFDENIARAEGYKLSWYGKFLQQLLMSLFPNQFCNIYVLTAQLR